MHLCGMASEEPTPPHGTKRKHEEQNDNGSKRPRLLDASEDTEVAALIEAVEDMDTEMAETENATVHEKPVGHTGKRQKYEHTGARSLKRPKRMNKPDDWMTEGDFFDEYGGGEPGLVDAGFFNEFEDDFNDDDLS